jgi:hypothetical protein
MIGVATLETVRLRQEAQRQTEMQLRPCVIFEPGDGKDFYVRNIGNSLALNVRVGTFALSPPAVYHASAVMVEFPHSVPFLSKGDKHPVLPIATVDGAVVAEEFPFEVLRPTPHDTPPTLHSFLPTLTIEFENILGQCYGVHERLFHGDIEILHCAAVTPPAGSKLRATGREWWAAGQKLWLAGQKLWVAGQQRQRKKTRASDSTALDEQEWVDGR